MYMEDLVEVRIHGRGGQGAVLAATLGAEVAFRSGYYPQAFPFFGAERRGAPVAAFLRYSSSPLMPRCRIYEPFCVTVFDAEILPPETVLNGLKEGGKLLLNTTGDVPVSWLGAAVGKKIYTVDAYHIAADCGLILSGMPLVSSVMVGALVRILRLASPGLLESILRDSITQYKNENIEGALRGYKGVEEVPQNAIL